MIVEDYIIVFLDCETQLIYIINLDLKLKI
jgi:hypothetical protein